MFCKMQLANGGIEEAGSIFDEEKTKQMYNEFKSNKKHAPQLKQLNALRQEEDLQ